MIITIYSIVAILLIPIAGYLSDRWGRNMVMVPSLLIAAIGGAITGWVSWKVDNPYTWILIGRAIQGIGAAGAMPVVIPCVGDLYKDEKQVSTGLGIIETSNTFGKVLSPILGSALAAIVWFLPFWAIPVLCIVSIVLLLVLVKAKKQEGEVPPLKEFIKSIVATFREKGRWLVQLLCLFYSEFSFICQLYWNQSMTFMVYGKGVYLRFRYLYCHLVHIWLVKNWR